MVYYLRCLWENYNENTHSTHQGRISCQAWIQKQLIRCHWFLVTSAKHSVTPTNGPVTPTDCSLTLTNCLRRYMDGRVRGWLAEASEQLADTIEQVAGVTVQKAGVTELWLGVISHWQVPLDYWWTSLSDWQISLGISGIPYAVFGACCHSKFACIQGFAGVNDKPWCWCIISSSHLLCLPLFIVCLFVLSQKITPNNFFFF